MEDERKLDVIDSLWDLLDNSESTGEAMRKWAEEALRMEKAERMAIVEYLRSRGWKAAADGVATGEHIR